MIGRWLAAWRRRREARTLEQRAIPDALWTQTLERFPFLQARAPSDLQRLRQLVPCFLAHKEFAGAQGLQVTDEIAVAVAAQACLPVLELGLAWYDGFVGIVLHPDEVVARREVTDESGVVHHYDELLAGEAMGGGPVMLSWRDVAQSGASADWGYNVVIHEFAHVIDLRDGEADGIPLLPDRAARARWVEVMQREYEAFCARVDAGEDTFLDPYGAEAIDEFFAVASEAFFVAAATLRAEHPPLYALLTGFYRQDPAAARA